MLHSTAVLCFLMSRARRACRCEAGYHHPIAGKRVPPDGTQGASGCNHGKDEKFLIYPIRTTDRCDHGMEDLEAIAKIVEEKDLFVISDEIYSELTYKGNPVSINTQIPGCGSGRF